MKKLILSLCIILLFSIPLFAESTLISQNTLGMGGASLADVSGDTNPANLASRGIDSPTLITYFTLMQTLTPNLIDTPLGFFQLPTTSLGAKVFGTNLGLTLNIDSSLEDRSYSDSILHYTGYNKFTLQLDWGYRISNFDFGMRIKGGSSNQRNNFELRANLFFLPDYLVNTLLSKYYPVGDSEFFTLGFAIRLNIYDNLTLAILSESDLELNSSSDNLSSYIKNFSVGFTYISDKYSEKNRLNPLIYKASFDLVKIGDSDNRELRFGNELKLQLGNDSYLALRAGYYEQKETLAKIFVFDGSKGVSTFALAYDINYFGISTSLIIPIKSYLDLDNGITLALNSIFRF